MDADTLRRLIVQLVAPLVVIASHKLGVDLGPLVDSLIVASFTSYNVFSNLKAMSTAKSAAHVEVATITAAAPSPASVTSTTTATEAKQ